MQKTLGQVAFETYADTLNWIAATNGKPIPQWNELSPAVKQAWENAANAAHAAQIFSDSQKFA